MNETIGVPLRCALLDVAGIAHKDGVVYRWSSRGLARLAILQSVGYALEAKTGPDGAWSTSSDCFTLDARGWSYRLHPKHTDAPDEDRPADYVCSRG